MEMDSNLIAALVGGIVGAVIGGLIGWWASYSTATLTHQQEIERNQIEEQALVNGFLQALKTELKVNWGLYTERYGKKVENLNSEALPLLPIDGNYLTSEIPT
jgi:hypothetical protein